MKMKMIKEKRQYLRIDDVVPIKYRKFDMRYGLMQKKSATRVDISGGGMKLMVEEEIPLGSWLEINLTLPTKDGFQTLCLIGEVIWCQKVGKDKKKRFLVGIAYLDISETLRRKIVRYVFERQIKKKKKFIYLQENENLKKKDLAKLINNNGDERLDERVNLQ